MSCAAGAPAYAANTLPGGRPVRTYRSAKTRDLHPDWYHADLGLLFRLHIDDHLHPLIADRLPLTDARQVHQRLAAGRVHGTLVLIP